MFDFLTEEGAEKSPTQLQPQPTKISDEDLDQRIRIEELRQKPEDQLAVSELDEMIAYEDKKQKSGYSETGRELNPQKNPVTEQAKSDLSWLPGAESIVEMFMPEEFGKERQKKVGEVSEDDEQLMNTFHDFVQYGELETYDEMVTKMEELGYNPARVRQLTEYKTGSESPYWDKYGSNNLMTLIPNQMNKLFLGGKELFTDLDPIDKESLTESQKMSKRIKDVSGISSNLMEIVPETAGGVKVFQVAYKAGKLGYWSAALANAGFQGGLTASSVKGEGHSQGSALAWGTAIGVLSGALTLIPLVPQIVTNRVLKYLDDSGIDENIIKENVLALDSVEDLSKLDVLQKKVLAVSKERPDMVQLFSDAITGGPEARKNIVETLIKKEGVTDLGLEKKTRQQWNYFFDEVVKKPEAFYAQTQATLKDKLSKASLSSKEFDINPQELKWNDEVMTNWTDMDRQTIEKFRNGEDVNFAELQSVRKAIGQQAHIFMEDGAKQLGQQMVAISKKIDAEAIPKLLNANVLPEHTPVLIETYEKAVHGYAKAQELRRSALGKILTGDTKNETIYKAVGNSFTTKNLDDVSQMERFLDEADEIAPKLRPIMEQTMIRDLVSSHRVPVSNTNKVEMVDWTTLARDLDQIPLSSIKSAEGKSALVMMKKIADVSQKDLALVRKVYGTTEASSLEQMGKTALGFNAKIVAGRQAIRKLTKYFNNTEAFKATLEQALKVKGSNLSETLLSMKKAGIVPKTSNKEQLKAFEEMVKVVDDYQQELNKEHNMKFLSENTEGKGLQADGKTFNTVEELIAQGHIKVNAGDIVPTASNGNTALILSDNIKVQNIGKIARLKTGDSMALEDVLQAPELYKQNPWLSKVKVVPYKNLDGTHMPTTRVGAADTDNGILYLNMNPDSSVTKEFVQTIMHEVGHMVNDVHGIPAAATMEDIQQTIATKYGANFDNFADDMKAPGNVASNKQMYEGQMDEQFANMNNPKATVDFGNMEMSENVNKAVDDAVWTKREEDYLKGKGLRHREIEPETEAATKIKVTQKMTRLIDELPEDRKMTPTQLRGWLDKQGVSAQELELSGLDSMVEKSGPQAKTMKEFKYMMDEIFDGEYKVSFDTRTQDDNTYMYTGISYKGKGIEDDTFRVNSQAMSIPKKFRDGDWGTPKTHGLGEHADGKIELGHSRMGTQDVGGEQTTVIHEIQSDWQQNSRQEGRPFEKEVAEYEKLYNWNKENSNTDAVQFNKNKERMYEISKKYPNENMIDYLEKNDGIPYMNGNFFDWYDLPDGSVSKPSTGEVWEKSADGKEWINITSPDDAPGKLPNRPIQRKMFGIADHPMSAKKYIQSQVVEGINFAIESGTNRVVIPIDRHLDDLKGTRGVTKAYENMEKPIADLVTKLKKQGMKLEFKRIVDKASKEFSVSEQENIGYMIEKLGYDMAEVAWSDGVDADDINDVIDFMYKESNKVNSAEEAIKMFDNIRQEYKNILVEKHGYDSFDADERIDDMFNKMEVNQFKEEFSDRNLYEIRIKGKEKGSEQRWDFMSLIGAVGLGSYYNKGNENVK